MAFDVSFNTQTGAATLSARRIWCDLHSLPLPAEWADKPPHEAEGGLRLGPNGIRRITPHGKVLYVAHHGAGRVVKVDVSSGQVMGQIVLPSRWTSSIGLAVNAPAEGAGGVLYVASVGEYSGKHAGFLYAVPDADVSALLESAPRHTEL